MIQRYWPHRDGELLPDDEGECVLHADHAAALAAKDAEIANGREQEKWLNRAWAAEKARAERAEQEAAALRAAGLELANQVDTLASFEQKVRAAIGNTNYNVLRLRIDEMRAALEGSK